MLAAIGLSRHAPRTRRAAAYITNVLPWRPPQNRDPSGDEAAMLLPFLFRHIELARPGGPAARSARRRRAPCSRTEAGVTRLRGRWHDWRGVPVIATFHPAALLRDPAKKREAWADLLLLQATAARWLTARAFLPVRIAVLTVSDTRGPAEDRSGDTLVERLTAAGPRLADRAHRPRRPAGDRGAAARPGSPTPASTW